MIGNSAYLPCKSTCENLWLIIFIRLMIHRHVKWWQKNDIRYNTGCCQWKLDCGRYGSVSYHNAAAVRVRVLARANVIKKCQIFNCHTFLYCKISNQLILLSILKCFNYFCCIENIVYKITHNYFHSRVPIDLYVNNVNLIDLVRQKTSCQMLWKLLAIIHMMTVPTIQRIWGNRNTWWQTAAVISSTLAWPSNPFQIWYADNSSCRPLNYFGTYYR